MDWNEETFEKHQRMALEDTRGRSSPLYLCEFADWGCSNSTLRFEIRREGFDSLVVQIDLGGEDGHIVTLPNGENVLVSWWRRENERLEKFLLDYPPTLYLADGSIITGCQHTEFQSWVDPLPDDFFDVWDWDGVDIETESAYKAGSGMIEFRADSVQQRVMERCREDGAVLVFNDDGSGESADVVAVVEQEALLTVNLFHCKFSKGANPGHRVGDLYEVCGQAVKSVKWKWNANALFKHLEKRRNKGLGAERRFFSGGHETLANLIRKLDYTDVHFEFWIVQPGIACQDLPEEIASILMSYASTITDMTECRLRCISSYA